MIRGTAEDGSVRAIAVQCTGVIEELRRRQDTWPTATAAMGRAATAGLMIGGLMKGEEKVTIRIQGDGPIGQIVVDANAHGEVRAYVDHPHVDLDANALGKFDVAGAVGTQGTLYIIKDLNMREPYRGSVPIVSGELGEDFTYYFAKSEQTPSAVALGVLIDPDESIRAAGGFIIQLLPGLSEERIAEIEKQLSQIRPITELLDRGESLEQIVKQIIPSFRLLGEQEVRFQCRCSRDRVEGMLRSLGKEELENMRNEDDGAEVICHFCNEPHRFTGEELAELAKD